jgi:hypothetical protein
MKLLFLTNNALLVGAVGGFAVLLCVFLFCFLFVHLCVLANVGWKVKIDERNKKAEEPSPKTEEKKAPAQKKEPAQEPIYYIVERKRTRSRPKTTYSEPKQIRFK